MVQAHHFKCRIIHVPEASNGTFPYLESFELKVRGWSRLTTSKVGFFMFGRPQKRPSPHNPLPTPTHLLPTNV